ncbi:D-inositol-3-phosphate glycosyltransferase [Shewanella sp. P1-14-1]|uniref:glycosyltransferase n=1 Tax=Shewanella sp. P1-14-1 TaxID=1723761 RepID=UPI0006D6618E|nr:glycosyltransferase [Shewanella sp. P1-14-1]KPZ72994.1 D-inositol-3-phosphate glycosyltransferase [Shewanella sp. P1-14-1]
MKRILLHYPFIPSYRIPVFNEMNSSSEFELLVLSAAKSNDETLLSTENGWGFNHIKTELRSISFFGKQFDFETGVINDLFKYRKKFEYYVILSNPNILSSWLYSMSAKLLGYKVIFWGHGLLKPDRGLKRLLRSLYYKIPDIHWLYGNNGKDLLIEAGIESNRIKVIYNSLDYDVQRLVRDKYLNDRISIRNNLGFCENDFVIVSIGRLLDKLKIAQIIKAISVSKSVTIKLVVIGDGPEKNNLVNLSENLNVLDSVSFVGAQYDENDIGKYFVAADASVVMGVVGLAAMHSLAYGIPMITHSTIEDHCPEIEAVVPGVTGEFFEQNNIDSFLDAVYKVNKNKGNYRNNCIQEIEKKYTPEQQVAYMLESIKNEL